MKRKTVRAFWPPKYYRGLTVRQARERRREILKYGAMDWKDPRAYVGFKTDRYPTRRQRSTYTLQWNREFPGVTTLADRAKVTGVPQSILEEVYRRGSAAWRTGHRPGQTTHSWSYPRVSSFLLCGKTHYTADHDLVRKAIQHSATARRWFRRCPPKPTKNDTLNRTSSMARRTRSHRKRPLRRRGGSYTLNPSQMISPGNLVVTGTAGPASDCSSDMNASRPGMISSTASFSKGLPGMSGGTRLLGGEDAMAAYAPYLTSSASSAPSSIAVPAISSQKGGSYATVLGGYPSNGVGASAIPSIQPISCAARYPAPMRGGATSMAAPTVSVGDSSSMGLQSPNAGYTQLPVQGASVPLMGRIGYPAGGANPACFKGGSRRTQSTRSRRNRRLSRRRHHRRH